MYKYYNANPFGRRVNDCTVRAISLATNESWDKTYKELSNAARKIGVMPDNTKYIDTYLERNFEKVYICEYGCEFTVGDFAALSQPGTYLITMNGHITCCIDGCIYDTFDPSDRIIWGIYKVRGRI